MAIKKLPQDVVEKIAAGEVVERPVSVVKELVENAIDSEATQIDIILEKAGTQKIEVRDNGTGMNRDDLQLCVQAHATSKIQDADDLFAINTLGFRGEALASICAVSKTTVITKQSDEVAGLQLQVNGGISEEIIPTAATNGTTVRVEDLFYNVPARQKFLKTQSTELQLIVALVTQLVLSHKEVGFTLKHNGSTLIQSSATEIVNEKIKDIYGRTIANETLSVGYENEGISVVGKIVKPSQVRADKRGMSFFVNGRFVKNNEFAKAVIDGYDTLLMIGKYPICVLHITIDPQVVDVNVHPRKDIIKIEDELAFLETLRHAVSDAFAKATLIRDVASNTVKISSSIQDELEQVKTVEPEELVASAVSNPKVFTNESIQTSEKRVVADLEPEKPTYVTQQHQHVLKETAAVREDSEKQLSVRYIGLLQKTFALCEDDAGLVMVDFHAAHERWNYEQFMDQFYNKTIKTQTLLQPLLLEVSPDQRVLIEKHTDLLKSWGFDIDEFGENEFVLRSIPIILGRTIDTAYFFKLLVDIESESKQNSLEVMQQKIITSMSCKASDRAGDDISSERAKQLIGFALDSEMKYACPHGRPTFVRISKVELEKMFKRRV